MILISRSEENPRILLFTDAGLGVDAGPEAAGTGNDRGVDRQVTHRMQWWWCSAKLSEPRAWGHSVLGTSCLLCP